MPAMIPDRGSSAGQRSSAAAGPTLALPDAPAIRGLGFRLFRDPADYAAIAELVATCSLHDGQDSFEDAASLQVEYEHRAGFDPHTDVILAELDGQLVGFGEAFRQVRGGRGVYQSVGAVRPDFRRRGIGRAILRHDERRLREVAKGHADPGGRSFGSWAGDWEGGARELLEAEGYRPVRFGFLMRRPTLEELPEADLLDGLELRPVRPADHRRIFETDVEAFIDSWEHREQGEEDFVALFALPDLDTSLWRVAWDGDEVCGSVMTFIWAEENRGLAVKRGWLERVSVRRPWRRRGVARALIVSALRGLAERGIGEAMLGVDAENVSGALGLYESLGFEVKQRGATYRKAW